MTCAGAATLNGNVTLGNASGDDITFTGSLASSIQIKTDATYDIGTSTLGLNKVYFTANSNSVSVGADASASADWNFTFPPASGTVGHGLQAASSGAHVYAPMQTDIKSHSDTDYTVTDTDGYRTIKVPANSADRVVTLPTAADNTGRRIKVINTDGTSKVTVKGEAAGETVAGISGTTGFDLVADGHFIEVESDGSIWMCVSYYTDIAWQSTIPTSISGVTIGNATRYIRYKKSGQSMLGRFQIEFGSTSSVTGNIIFTIPNSLNADSNFLLATGVDVVGHGQATDTGTNSYLLTAVYETATTIRLYSFNASGTYVAYDSTTNEPFTYGSGDRITILFEIPISEWANTIPA